MFRRRSRLHCIRQPRSPVETYRSCRTGGYWFGYVWIDERAVTGNRGRGATSKMRCIDVAALFAAAILRRNPDSVVIPFDTSAYDAKIDPNDSILSIAERLAKYGGGEQIVRCRYSCQPEACEAQVRRHCSR